ncbi:sugar phosphate isomerase/epimerase [Acetobacter sp. DsW_063]|uniref:sugar phosphate isomerase/epimerase family protein n=1 Tax=Acetobacter sp. DsW_063 TaxID=1514894 RepID=UPI000B657D9B|nr:sugar phosphate isomerase/epimerase family protein [Acetobacter sp. DsW_063]OUJ14312.1 hypothetical protein HK28_14035 [Acetobacter sp. DsW_063]
MSILSRLHISEISTKNLTLREDVELYRRHGLGIELWESKFSHDNFEAEIDWLGEQDIHVSSLQPDVMTVFPSMSVLEPQDPDERVRLFCRAVDRFSRILKGGVMPTQTGALPTGDEDLVWKTSTEAYKKIADYAARRDIKIALEPLGASLMNRSTIVSNIVTALEMLDEVNHPNFGICADSYNLWESTALDQVSLCGEKLFLVHLADWRRPRNFHDRHIPGDGVIPNGEFLRRIQDIGYTGDYVVELFSDGVPNSLWSQDPESVVRRIRQGVAAAVAKSGTTE